MKKLPIFSQLENLITQLVIQFRGFLNWMLDGVGHFAPENMRSKKWAIYRSERQSNSGKRILVERSLLGKQRVYSGNNLEDTSIQTPRINRLIINEHDFFISRITLPLSARRKVYRALLLRLEELSPLPIDETIFSWNVVSDDKLLEVDVAIANKMKIEKIENQETNHHDILEITSYAPVNAIPRFVFERSINPNKKIKWKKFYPILGLTLSLNIFWFGLNHHYTKIFVQQENETSTLIAAIKIEKKNQLLATTLLDYSKTKNPTLTVNNAIKVTNTFHQNLPSEVVLKSATISINQIDAKGFIPITTELSPKKGMSVSIAQSKVPGYSNAVFTLNREGEK